MLVDRFCPGVKISRKFVAVLVRFISAALCRDDRFGVAIYVIASPVVVILYSDL